MFVAAANIAAVPLSAPDSAAARVSTDEQFEHAEEVETAVRFADIPPVVAKTYSDT